MTAPLDEARDLLARLIGFPTVSSDSNLDLIDWVRDRLAPLGAGITLTRNEAGTKANLFATIGPETDGGIVLSGHTDVVPVTGQDWSTDPFDAHEADGAVFGRGACDMKGFLACALALAPRFAAVGLSRPLHLAFTYDEEVGCLGAPHLIEAMAVRPSVCIIGEPTEMRVVEGHKGCHEYLTRFNGLEGHSSRPELGVNAIEYAARFVGELLETREDLKERAPPDSPFEPPWTTLSVGMIGGGIAANVIAGACEVAWEFRPVGPEDARYVKERVRRYLADRLEPAMKAVDPASSIEHLTVGEVAGLVPMNDSEAVRLAVELTGGNARGTVAFATEGGLFQSAGIPTVVCGPGSILQAHKPDEFVTLDQLSQCVALIERLLDRLRAEPPAA